MRKKGEEHLPQHIEEEDDAYDLRVTSTVLLNAFEEAVDGVVSRVFAEPVIVTEEAHDEFVDAADDITGLGENLDGFARRAFQSGRERSGPVEPRTDEPGWRCLLLLLLSRAPRLRHEAGAAKPRRKHDIVAVCRRARDGAIRRTAGNNTVRSRFANW